MEGHASPMVPSGGFSGPEHRLEGSNSNSTGMSFSRGDHDDGAQGTARAPKQRKARSENWSDNQTQQLLDACLELKGRCRMRAQPRKWQSISRSVNGKTADECEGRMETLTKSFNRIKKHCALHQKQFDQLSEEEFKRLELPTKLPKSHWYYQMCKIKEQPKNRMGASSRVPRNKSLSSSSPPAAVMVALQSRGWERNVEIMPELTSAEEPSKGTRQQLLASKFGRRGCRCPPACQCTRESDPMQPSVFFFFSSEQSGPHGDTIGEVVGTPEAASAAHQHVNRVEPWIATVADAAESPPVDHEYLQVYDGLEDLGYLSPLRA